MSGVSSSDSSKPLLCVLACSGCSAAGELADHWSVTVNGNWRMTFTFEGEDAILVDYQDYH